MRTLKSTLRGTANFLLSPIGVEIARKKTGAEANSQSADAETNPYALGYIPAKETVDAAEKAGLSVSDYLEKNWGSIGYTKRVTDKMKALGVSGTAIKNICEIGTGSGMYLEKVLSIYNPLRYESYEPNKEWAEWLASKYSIISYAADGKSLGYTESSSIDLVHAHGVFVYLPFLTTYRYFQEIDRVTNNGGYVVFDIMSEECFDDSTVSQWLQSDWNYPCFLSKQYVINFFVTRGFTFLGEFSGVIGLGKSLYIGFEKNSLLGLSQIS